MSDQNSPVAPVVDQPSAERSPKSKITFEVTVETNCEPEFGHGPYATARVTVTVGAVSVSEMSIPSHIGGAIDAAYKAACIAFTARALETP